MARAGMTTIRVHRGEFWSWNEVGMRSTLVALLAVTVLFAGACSSTGTSSNQRDPRGLAHIHGLGVNPADGALYAGTHYGVYRLANERDPELVGGVVQDFMGFTVTGPNHFLAAAIPERPTVMRRRISG